MRLLFVLFAALAFVSADDDGGDSDVCAPPTPDPPPPPGEEGRVRSTIIIILTILIVCTLIFEFAKDKLEEKVKGELAPIMNSMWKELTILGFLGIVSFIAQDSGKLSVLSCQLFDGRDEFIPEQLEKVHMLLFLVMMVFLAQVLLLAALSHRITRRWRALEVKRRADEIKIYQEFLEATPPCYVPTLCENKSENDVETMEYCMLRDSFVASHSKATANFDLAEYFSHILGEEVGDMVEVSLATWVAVECVFVFFFFYFSAESDAVRIGGVIGFGYLMMLWCIGVRLKMNRIFHWLLPHLPRVKAVLHRGGMRARSGEQLAAEAAGTVTASQAEAGSVNRGDVIDNIHHMSEATGLLAATDGETPVPKELLDEHRTPYYITKDQLPERSWCARTCFGKSANRHQRLFWFDARGPRFLFLVMQFTMVMISVYLATFSFYVAPLIASNDSGELELDMGGRVMLIIVGYLPILIIIFDLMPFIIRRHIEISQTEMMKNDNVIRKVVRQMKTRRALRAMKLLHMISWTEERKKRRAAGIEESMEDRRADDEEFSQKQMQSFRDMFDLYDTDKSGAVDAAELQKMFDALGHPIDDAMLKLMLKTVDDSGDGTVEFSEFVELMRGYNRIQEMQPEECVDVLFAMFDKDGEGTISIDEFVSALNSLGEENFSLHDIQEMVREIDENGDGEVDKEEFATLMRKYHTVSE